MGKINLNMYWYRAKRNHVQTYNRGTAVAAYELADVLKEGLTKEQLIADMITLGIERHRNSKESAHQPVVLIEDIPKLVVYYNKLSGSDLKAAMHPFRQEEKRLKLNASYKDTNGEIAAQKKAKHEVPAETPALPAHVPEVPEAVPDVLASGTAVPALPAAPIMDDESSGSSRASRKREEREWEGQSEQMVLDIEYESEDFVRDVHYWKAFADQAEKCRDMERADAKLKLETLEADLAGRKKELLHAKAAIDSLKNKVAVLERTLASGGANSNK